MKLYKILVVFLMLMFTSCTHRQMEWYAHEATPEQQRQTVELIRYNQATTSTRNELAFHPFLVCVRHHESDRGPYPHMNGYQAQNRRSTASGAYQFLDGTWRSVSTSSGHGGYAKARYAPPWMQDAVAMWTYQHYGAKPWAGSGCH